MSYISERTQPILMANMVAGTSYTVANSASVNLATYQADSLFVVATILASTGTGFTMTAQGGATTSALGAYCAVPGSTATLVTCATTVTGGKVLYIDMKNVPHQYVGVKHTGLGAVSGSIVGYPYDSKLQVVPMSADLASTVSGAGPYVIVNPTTA